MCFAAVPHQPHIPIGLLPTTIRIGIGARVFESVRIIGALRLRKRPGQGAFVGNTGQG